MEEKNIKQYKEDYNLLKLLKDYLENMSDNELYNKFINALDKGSIISISVLNGYIEQFVSDNDLDSDAIKKIVSIQELIKNKLDVQRPKYNFDNPDKYNELSASFDSDTNKKL